MTTPGLLACLVTLSIGLVGCATTAKVPLKTVDYVDLPRFMGDWFVVANIPYFAEKDCVGSVEEYRLQPDGKIDTTFRAWKPDFDGKRVKVKSLATVVNTKTNAEWKIQFIWPLKFDYLVIDLAEDYRYAVVGHPSRNYVWILARTPKLADADAAGILKRLTAQNYDVTRIAWIPQRAAE